MVTVPGRMWAHKFSAFNPSPSTQWAKRPALRTWQNVTTLPPPSS